MNARANRGVGKSDPLDARRIAQAVLPTQDGHLRHPRRDEGVRAAIRVLIASRDHISTERTAAINALIALLRAVDLGVDSRGTLNVTQLTAIATWRPRTEPLATRVARAEAIRLAKRIRTADGELGDLTRQMTDLLKSSPAADLLEQPGIELGERTVLAQQVGFPRHEVGLADLHARLRATLGRLPRGRLRAVSRGQ